MRLEQLEGIDGLVTDHVLELQLREFFLRGFCHGERGGWGNGSESPNWRQSVVMPSEVVVVRGCCSVGGGGSRPEEFVGVLLVVVCWKRIS